MGVAFGMLSLSWIAAEILCYFICTFGNGSHLWFTSYPDVAECPHQFCRVGGLRKCGCSLWKFAAVWSKSWDLSKFGFTAAILDLLFPVTSISTCGNRSNTHTHCLNVFQVFLIEQYAFDRQCRYGNKKLPNIVKNWFVHRYSAIYILGLGRDIFMRFFTITCIHHPARNT